MHITLLLLCVQVGSWNASQTNNEQDEDAGSPFRSFKTAINSVEAEQYEKENPEIYQQVDAILGSAGGLRLTRKARMIFVSTLLRAQYAHAKCFTFAARLTQARITGHHPFNIDVIFDRHPAMSQADPAEQQHCKDQLPALQELFGLKGFFDETDLDAKGIPETKEQAAARAQGKPVKSELLAEWRHGFSWDNHANTTLVRQAARDAATRDAAVVAATQAAKARDAQSLVAYQTATRPIAKTKISAALQDKYSYERDMRCKGCCGWWSVWVFKDLDTKTRVWKTPTRIYEQKHLEESDWQWFCGVKACAQMCAAEDRRARELNRLQRDAKKIKDAAKPKQPKPPKTSAKSKKVSLKKKVSPKKKASSKKKVSPKTKVCPKKKVSSKKKASPKT